MRVTLSLLSIALLFTSTLQTCRTAAAYFQATTFTFSQFAQSAHNAALVLNYQAQGYIHCLEYQSAQCLASIASNENMAMYNAQAALVENENHLALVNAQITTCVSACTHSSALSPLEEQALSRATFDAEYFALIQNQTAATAAIISSASSALDALFSSTIDETMNGMSSLLDDYQTALDETRFTYTYNVQHATNYVGQLQIKLASAFDFISNVAAIAADFEALGLDLGAIPVQDPALPLSLAPFPNIPSQAELIASRMTPISHFVSLQRETARAQLQSLVEVSSQPLPPYAPPDLNSSPSANITTAPYQIISQSAQASSLPGGINASQTTNFTMDSPVQIVDQVVAALEHVADVLTNLDIAVRVLHALRIWISCWGPTRLEVEPIDMRNVQTSRASKGIWFVAIALAAASMSAGYLWSWSVYRTLASRFVQGCLEPDPGGTLITSNLNTMGYNWAASQGAVLGQTLRANISQTANEICVSQTGGWGQAHSQLVSQAQALYSLGASSPCNCSTGINFTLPRADDWFQCGELLAGCSLDLCAGPQPEAIGVVTLQSGCAFEGVIHAYVTSAFLSLGIYVCVNLARMAVNRGLVYWTVEIQAEGNVGRAVVVELDAQGAFVPIEGSGRGQIQAHDDWVKNMSSGLLVLALGLNVMWLCLGEG